MTAQPLRAPKASLQYAFLPPGPTAVRLPDHMKVRIEQVLETIRSTYEVDILLVYLSGPNVHMILDRVPTNAQNICLTIGAGLVWIGGTTCVTHVLAAPLAPLASASRCIRTLR